MLRSIFLSLTLLTAQPLLAQTAATTVHTSAELGQVEAKLQTAAEQSPTGEAGQVLEDQGTSWLILVARARTGEAELHNEWADEIFVRAGTLTVVYGGTMSEKHPFGNRPGEFHSATMQGGTTQTLHTGEWMHIPAGVPHWVKLTPGESSTSLVVKEK
jgi:uncharacterized RmlC-like cupin family protein